MTITPVQLVPAQFVGTSPTLYFTSTNTKTRIDKATFTNTDNASSHNVSIYLVPNGQSPNPSNLLVVARAIAQKVTYHAPEMVGHILAQGDMIYASTDTANQVSFAAAGVAISP